MVGPNTVHHVGHRSLTLSVGSEFRSELLAAIGRAHGSLVLDFSHVECIDSHCMGVLVLTARLLPKGFTLLLAGLQTSVERSLRSAHIQRLLPVYPDAEAALRHLAEAEQVAEHA
ncbi:MAG: hypothetical protein PWP23_2249 [Candidatus Sumerlaeota bacterium]|nr:hypothetical protein [Candidatus Sumerlaeota bacterium]